MGWGEIVHCRARMVAKSLCLTLSRCEDILAVSEGDCSCVIMPTVAERETRLGERSGNDCQQDTCYVWKAPDSHKRTHARFESSPVGTMKLGAIW